MRRLDDAAIESIHAALQQQRSGCAADAMLLHQIEQWRDRLLAETGHEQALTEWLQHQPQTDAQQLRALIRQARKEQQALPPAPAGQGPRHGKAYRSVFQLLQQALKTQDA